MQETEPTIRPVIVLVGATEAIDLSKLVYVHDPERGVPQPATAGRWQNTDPQLGPVGADSIAGAVTDLQVHSDHLIVLFHPMDGPDLRTDLLYEVDAGLIELPGDLGLVRSTVFLP